MLPQVLSIETGAFICDIVVPSIFPYLLLAVYGCCMPYHLTGARCVTIFPGNEEQ